MKKVLLYRQQNIIIIEFCNISSKFFLTEARKIFQFYRSKLESDALVYASEGFRFHSANSF